MPWSLASRHRLVLRALGEALFVGDAPHGATTAAQLDALVAGVEAHLRPVSRVQRAMLLVALDVVRWLPVLLFTSLVPFEAVPVRRRVALLERMDRSSWFVLLIPLVAYKTLLSMHYFESATELRAMGYPGDTRKRWLRPAS